MISFAALIPILLVWVLFSVPMFFLTNRLGLSRLWWLFLIVPLYGPLILLWIVSLKKWPAKSALEVFE